MDRVKPLKLFVVRAKRSLNFEKSIPSLQYGLLLAVGVYTAILLVSRLFVFPYYHNVALFSSIGVLILTFVYIWWNRAKNHDALIRLDAFYPHNELVTALSVKDDSNPLVDSILQKAQKASTDSFAKFKQRKKQLWRPKALIVLALMVIVVGALYIFPSPTQQEAVVIEKENEVIDELEKEVAELEKKTTNEEIKKQLQELLNKLKEVDSSEEALREVVKKQKELKLQEQNLQDKKDVASQGEEGAEGLSAEEEEQLKVLLELQSALGNSASSTQTALSKLGKPISFDLQNAIAQESGGEASFGENSSDNGGENQGNSGNQNNSSGQQSNGQGNGNNQGGNNGSKSQGTNGSQGQGGTGQGNGSGKGQGQGNGGSGTGGQGLGTGSNGAGFGQGSRDLLSIPERFGENGEVIVDGGPLGEGTPVGEQEGPVPVTKGTIRPYEEVVGQYKVRYMESSDRMQLPKDLQDIVQSYFSSLESE